MMQECLIQVTNPVCKEDVLTDRWPGTLRDQTIFISDLENLVAKVERLVSGCNLGEMNLGEMKKIMVEVVWRSTDNGRLPGIQ